MGAAGPGPESDVTTRDLGFFVLCVCLGILGVSAPATSLALSDWWLPAGASVLMVLLVWAGTLRHPSLGYRLRRIALTLGVVAPLPFIATRHHLRGDSDLVFVFAAVCVLFLLVVPIDWLAASSARAAKSER
jgi:hypothetical protein